MRAIGVLVFALLSVAGCSPVTSTGGDQMPPAVANEDIGVPTSTPIAVEDIPDDAPDPDPSAPVLDAEIITALTAMETAESMLTLVEQGELDTARSLVDDGSPLDWSPSEASPWADEYGAAAGAVAWYLQLFDADGPSEDELAEWRAAMSERIAAFNAAAGDA